MKKIFFSFLIVFLSITSFAQNGLLVHSNDKGMYVVHTVQQKENFYSIGRLYAISPKEIAAFNNVDMTHGLEIGQSLSIPLQQSNFSQSKSIGTPVYYVVGEKEGLYRVSLKNGKVLMASLRKWNNLKTDDLSTGQRLIVGFLQSVELAKNPPALPAVAPPIAQAPQPQQEAQQPVAVTPAPQPAAQNNNTTQTASRPVESRPVQNTQPAPVAGGAGYFKNQYEAQKGRVKTGRDATVASGIFKTTSGFQDAKYYALMDQAEPGTIVQVINPANNKSIYAKVLGEMSGIRQNQGLELRISNAAASALGISDEKFTVRVMY